MLGGLLLFFVPKALCGGGALGVLRWRGGVCGRARCGGRWRLRGRGAYARGCVGGIGRGGLGVGGTLGRGLRLFGLLGGLLLLFIPALCSGKALSALHSGEGVFGCKGGRLLHALNGGGAAPIVGAVIAVGLAGFDGLIDTIDGICADSVLDQRVVTLALVGRVFSFEFSVFSCFNFCDNIHLLERKKFVSW